MLLHLLPHSLHHAIHLPIVFTGKKKKGSWDLLAPKDRQTRFWVEQFGRDSEAGNAEAAKLQRIVDRKTEENRLAKENWEKEVKKMLKFLYQMDKKVRGEEDEGILEGR